MYQSIVVIVLLFRYTHSQDAVCDLSYNVSPGTTYTINSPNYPNYYRPGGACRWIATCPSGYNCRLDCALEIPQTSTCDQGRFLISKSGDAMLTGADFYCGQGSVSAVSTGQRISWGHTSPPTYPTGRYSCKLYAQAATTAPTCSCGIRRTNRIVGGQQTDPYEFPMMAGVRYVDQDQIRCGAVIIANNYVLSAAHCVAGKRPVDITVEVGVYNQANSPPRRSLTVFSILIHPQYTSTNYDYDISIIRTQQMEFNYYISPVCLPFKYANYDFTGAQLTLIGWGTTSFGGPVSSVLRKVDVSVLSQSSCQSRVSTLTPRQLCTFTSGKDSCQDDSGGPALYTDPQTGLLYNAGIISFGKFCASDSPGISTRITALLNWITQNAPANYCGKPS